jgi:hypothetical protein
VGVNLVDVNVQCDPCRVILLYYSYAFLLRRATQVRLHRRGYAISRAPKYTPLMYIANLHNEYTQRSLAYLTEPSAIGILERRFSREWFCRSGGTGRRARLKLVWGNPCGFDSHLRHSETGYPTPVLGRNPVRTSVGFQRELKTAFTGYGFCLNRLRCMPGEILGRLLNGFDFGVWTMCIEGRWNRSRRFRR